jgi:hypothetical protein
MDYSPVSHKLCVPVEGTLRGTVPVTTSSKKQKRKKKTFLHCVNGGQSRLEFVSDNSLNVCDSLTL